MTTEAIDRARRPAILWVLLIPFFTFAEVQRSLGRAALLRLLFERRDLLSAAKAP